MSSSARIPARTPVWIASYVLGVRLDPSERAALMAEGATLHEEDACRLALAS